MMMGSRYHAKPSKPLSPRPHQQRTTVSMGPHERMYLQYDAYVMSILNSSGGSGVDHFHQQFQVMPERQRMGILEEVDDLISHDARTQLESLYGNTHANDLFQPTVKVPLTPHAKPQSSPHTPSRMLHKKLFREISSSPNQYNESRPSDDISPPKINVRSSTKELTRKKPNQVVFKETKTDTEDLQDVLNYLTSPVVTAPTMKDRKRNPSDNSPRRDRSRTPVTRGHQY